MAAGINRMAVWSDQAAFAEARRRGLQDSLSTHLLFGGFPERIRLRASLLMDF